MRRWLVVVALLVVAGFAVTAMRQNKTPAAPVESAPPAVPVEVATVETGTVALTVEMSGTVTSARMTEVMSKISGRIARVRVQDGARVAAGQVLIELESGEQRAELAQAEAAVRAAEAGLAALEAGLRPQERQVVFNQFTAATNQVKAAETQVALAQATLKVAEDNLRRHEQLLRDGAVARAQVDQARLQAEQARAQVKAAEVQLEIASVALDSARQQWDMTETGAREEDLKAARAQVAAARAVVALAKQRVASTIIRAPFAGRVSSVTASVGDYVVSGDFGGRSGYVAIVYDDRAMEVEARISERDLALIKVGQRARAQLETGGEPVEAAVRTVSPIADPASRAATVRLRLRDAGDARPGTFARGEIIVDERSNVLLAPKAAVVGGANPVVRVVVNDTVQVRPVTLGLTSGERVEIRSGVAAGEVVVTLGPEGLANGTRVRVSR